VDPLRILLIAVPRLLGDIVRRAGGDVLVVGDQTGPDDLVAAVDSLSANVVVFGSAANELPGSCRSLLERRPSVKVIVVGGDMRHTTLYELRPHRLPLGDVSPKDLVAAIRAAVAASAAAW
jgi:hypothetical protein